MDWQKYDIHIGYQTKHDEKFDFKLYVYNIYHCSEDKKLTLIQSVTLRWEDQDM